MEVPMGQTAKIFKTGRSQAVRLPLAYRFDTSSVFIRKDQRTGDVILSRRPDTWDRFLQALSATEVPPDFLDKEERQQGAQPRDPLPGWPGALMRPGWPIRLGSLFGESKSARGTATWHKPMARCAQTWRKQGCVWPLWT